MSLIIGDINNSHVFDCKKEELLSEIKTFQIQINKALFNEDKFQTLTKKKIEILNFIDEVSAMIRSAQDSESLEKSIEKFSSFFKTSALAFSFFTNPSLVFPENEFSDFSSLFTEIYRKYEGMREVLKREHSKEELVKEIADLIDQGVSGAFSGALSERMIFYVEYQCNFELELRYQLIEKALEEIEKGQEPRDRVNDLQTLTKIVNIVRFEQTKTTNENLKLLKNKAKELFSNTINILRNARNIPEINEDKFSQDNLSKLHLFVLENERFLMDTNYIQSDVTFQYFRGKHSIVFEHKEIPGLIFKIMSKKEAAASKAAIDSARDIFREENLSNNCHIPRAEIAGELSDSNALMIMEKAPGNTNKEDAELKLTLQFQYIYQGSELEKRWQEVTRDTARGIAKIGYWDVGFHNLLLREDGSFDWVDFEKVSPIESHIRQGLERLINMIPCYFVPIIYEVAAQNDIALREPLQKACNRRHMEQKKKEAEFLSSLPPPPELPPPPPPPMS